MSTLKSLVDSLSWNRITRKSHEVREDLRRLVSDDRFWASLAEVENVIEHIKAGKLGEGVANAGTNTTLPAPVKAR